MGRPVGSIIQAGIETVVNGQRLLNVLHYKVKLESTEPDAKDEQENFATQLNAVGGIVAKMRAAMSQDATVVRVVAHFIRDQRFARSTLEITGAGLIAEDCTAQNVTATLTKRTAFAGRWAVGSFHLGGLPVTGYVSGNLEPVYKGLVEDLANQLLVEITVPITGGTYTPVLLHPPAAHDGSTELREIDVQETLRVMRRRTVGLGI